MISRTKQMPYEKELINNMKVQLNRTFPVALDSAEGEL